MKAFFSSKRNCRGFTLIETIVVASTIVTLLGFITINLARSQQTVSLTSTQDLLLADLKQQSIKSMIGDTEGRATSDSYGIHFEERSYVAFHSSSYSPGDTSNSITNLESNMQFNNAGFDIIFSRLSGEITAPTTIELQDNTSSRLRKIYLNRYGVVIKIESL